jgi:hypothetical protein
MMRCRKLSPKSPRFKQRQRRIAELEAWAKMSSAQMVEKAQSGMLSADPYFAEWLVLLDRGDLL